MAKRRWRWDGSAWVSIFNEADYAPVANGNPTGTIIMWAGAKTGVSLPTGYLECDGSTKSRTTFADLFAVIGTTYGAGDGSTTFNLPLGTSAVPFGIASTANTRATSVSSGVQSANHAHTLTALTLGNNSADHTHNLASLSLNSSGATHTHNFSDYYNTGTEHTGKVTSNASANHDHTLVSGATGNQSATHTHVMNASTIGNQSADHSHATTAFAVTFLIKT